MKRAPFTISTPGDQATVANAIVHLNLEGGRKWQVTIEPFKKKRTLSQNALMWKWIGEVANLVHKETGQDADDIHEFFKTKFLPARIVEIAGETIERRTTTKLSTQEMSDYMTKIHAFVTSELGFILPLPEEMHLKD